MLYVVRSHQFIMMIIIPVCYLGGPSIHKVLPQTALLSASWVILSVAWLSLVCLSFMSDPSVICIGYHARLSCSNHIA